MPLDKVKSLLKQSFIYSFGGSLGKLANILLVPLYTRFFSPSEYGIIDLANTVIFFLTIFIPLGIDWGAARFFLDTGEKKNQKIVASSCILTILLLSFFWVLILSTFGSRLSYLLFNNRDYTPLVWLILISVPFGLFVDFSLNILKWEARAKTYAGFSIIMLITHLLLIILFLFLLKTGLTGIYIARVVTFFLFAFIGFFLIKNYLSLSFSFQNLKVCFLFGFPCLPFILSHYVVNYSDRYFLKYFWGLKYVGYYGVGYMLASILSLGLVGFQHAWGPFMYKNYRNEESKALFARIYNYCSFLICCIIVVISVYAKELLYIFGGAEYTMAFKIVPVLLISIAAYFFGGYFSVGVGVSKRTFHNAWVGVTTASLNLLLNSILIPRWNILGAAVATMISFLFLATALITISQKYYRIPFKFRSNFIMYAAVVSIILTSYRCFPQVNMANSLFKLILVLGFIFIPFKLHIVSRREFIHILNLFAKSKHASASPIA